MKTRISSYLLNGSTGCLSRTYNGVYLCGWYHEYANPIILTDTRLYRPWGILLHQDTSLSLTRTTRYLPVQTTRPEMLKRGFGREDSIILDNSSLPNNSTWQTYTNTNSWCEVTRHNIASIHGWTFWCKVIRQWNVCVEVCRLPAYWRVHSLEKRYAD